MSDVVSGLVVAAAIGAGTIGGVFFGFSSFVMRALARLPAPAGIAAMQSINVVVINPWFLVTFLGTGMLCLGLGAISILRIGDEGYAYVLAGSALYLMGSIVVTMAFNVPRNNRLAAVDPENVEGTEVWQRYVPEWTAWNTVRTVASLAACAAFIAALVVSRN